MSPSQLGRRRRGRWAFAEDCYRWSAARWWSPRTAARWLARRGCPRCTRRWWASPPRRSRPGARKSSASKGQAPLRWLPMCGRGRARSLIPSSSFARRTTQRGLRRTRTAASHNCKSQGSWAGYQRPETVPPLNEVAHRYSPVLASAKYSPVPCWAGTGGAVAGCCVGGDCAKRTSLVEMTQTSLQGVEPTPVAVA